MGDAPAAPAMRCPSIPAQDPVVPRQPFRTRPATPDGSGSGGRSGIAGLFGLGAFALFATHDAIIKSLGGTYSTFQIVFFSVLFTFPLTTFFLMGDRTSATLLPHHPWWIAARSIAAMLSALCAFYAFSTLPLAQVYAVLFATPILITLLAIPILGETVRLHRWFAIVAGLIGVFIALRPGALELGLGHVAALMTAVCGALSGIIVRKIGPEERAVVLILYPLVGNFLLAACVMPFAYKPVPLADLAASAAAAALSFTGMLLTILAYRRGSASVVAPMQYSQILWATLYGALFFGETLDLYTSIGAAIVIASGLYIVVRENAPGASSNTPVLSTRPRLETGSMVTASVDPENLGKDD